MSISGEKLYTEPGSVEEKELQEEEAKVHSNNTGAKPCKGKTVAATLLVVGALAAGIIFGTKAVHTIQDTRAVDNLIASYQVENYVDFPSTVTVDRAYDITFADGKMLANRLNENHVDYVRINGQFYTREGMDIALLTYKVTYTDTIDATKVTRDGQTIYMAPSGYTLNGNKAKKTTIETRTVVVPAGTDYSFVSFPEATSFELVGEEILHTLSYDVINNSTLICDVADGVSLNDNNECVGTLDIVPKKH